MPRMFNPDTQEVREVRGPEVRDLHQEGFVVVGNRPEDEYMGKTREELEEPEPTQEDVDEGSAEQISPTTIRWR